MVKRDVISVDCGERDESIAHLILDSKKLTQKEFQEPYDIEAEIVDLGLCQKSRDVRWYNHKLKSAMENEKVKIL